eukprot:3461781-Pyramimonas_sp.AAC.1
MEAIAGPRWRLSLGSTFSVAEPSEGLCRLSSAERSISCWAGGRPVDEPAAQEENSGREYGSEEQEGLGHNDCIRGTVRCRASGLRATGNCFGLGCKYYERSCA